jgi:hypothetical protein
LKGVVRLLFSQLIMLHRCISLLLAFWKWNSLVTAIYKSHIYFKINTVITIQIFPFYANSATITAEYDFLNNNNKDNWITVAGDQLESSYCKNLLFIKLFQVYIYFIMYQRIKICKWCAIYLQLASRSASQQHLHTVFFYLNRSAPSIPSSNDSFTCRRR